MENNSYMCILGEEAKWFLNSKNYINPSLVYLWGSHYFSFGLFFFTHSLIHSISCRSHLSLFSHSVHSFTHSSFLNGVLSWVKENKLLERIHGFVGYKDYWYVSTMNQGLHV
jgi:hypothetical protein